MTGIGLMTIVLAVAPGDLAGDVKTVFSAKCAACHGPNLAKPKGRFGYVLDLDRVAGNREMVVPGESDQSELWELIRRGEMPPEDSPTGALTADQKEAVRAWIAAGAPADIPSTANASPKTTEDTKTALTVLPAVLRQLGRFHVVLVHFPIALLFAAVAGEVWSVWVGRSTPAPAVHFCVMLGAVGAVASAVFGWLLAADGATALTTTLGLHRWLGTATAGWAIFTAVLSVRDGRRGVRSGSFRAALLVAAILVGVTGHLGGTLVFGNEFFTAA